MERARVPTFIPGTNSVGRAVPENVQPYVDVSRLELRTWQGPGLLSLRYRRGFCTAYLSTPAGPKGRAFSSMFLARREGLEG